MWIDTHLYFYVRDWALHLHLVGHIQKQRGHGDEEQARPKDSGTEEHGCLRNHQKQLLSQPRHTPFTFRFDRILSRIILRISFCKRVYYNSKFKLVKYLKLKAECVKTCTYYIYFFPLECLI